MTNLTASTFHQWEGACWLSEALVQENKFNVVIDISGGWNFIKGKVRAVSLDVVDDQESLNTKIIQPLLDM